MARKSGCPFSCQNYDISIEDKLLSTAENRVWKKIKGLTSISMSLSADTEDGKSGGQLWNEPYVTGRSMTLSLEGKPIQDKTTGAWDSGQEALNEAAALDGSCDNDQSIRIADGVGHCTIFDVIVTGSERGADETSESISWDCDVIGQPEEQDYVQVSSVAAKDGETTLDATTNTLAMTAGSDKEVTVAFTPDTASNKKFSIGSTDKSVANVTDISDTTVTVRAYKAGNATINLKTMNGGKTTTFKVVVT